MSADLPYRTGDPDTDCTLHTLHALATPDDEATERLYALDWTDTARVEPRLLATGGDFDTLYATLNADNEPHVDMPYDDLDNPRIGLALALGGQVLAADACGRTYTLIDGRWHTTDAHGREHGTPGAHPTTLVRHLAQLALAHHDKPLALDAHQP